MTKRKRTLRERAETCGSFKMGEYDLLVCCREKNHEGYHNYVVDYRAGAKSRRKGK